MKKNIICKIFCLSACFVLVSCGSKSSSEESSNEQNASSIEETRSEQSSSNEEKSSSENYNPPVSTSVSSDSHDKTAILTLNDVDDYFRNSKPTQIVTLMKYSYPETQFSVELQYSSVLNIQYTDDGINAKYTATKEKINDSLDGDFIISETETYYVSGSDYGSLQDGSIVWNSPVENKFVLRTPTITSTYFNESKCSFTDSTFSGMVISGNEKGFIGSDVSSLKLELSFKSQEVKTLNSTFVTSKKANVSIACSYTYNPITVTIPQ